MQIYSEKPSDLIKTCGWFVVVTGMSDLCFAGCVSMIFCMLTCNLKGVCGHFCAISEGRSGEGQAELSNPQVA